jgi:hypothetical protein
MSVADTITQKAGPLPVWAWGLGVGAVGVTVRWYMGRHNKTVSDTDSASAATDENTGLVDNSGWGSAPYTSGTGAGMGNSGAIDDQSAMGLASINPATGRPYLVDIADPQDPNTGQSYAAGAAAAAAREQALQDMYDALRSQIDAGSQQVTAPPAAVPAPNQVEPTAPRPAASFPTPVPGTVIWSGTTQPNNTTVNNLIRARYGKPVSWHSVPVKKDGKVVSYKAVLQ